MNARLLVPALLAASALHGDTVLMRDGTRFEGTFVSGSARSVTIVDESGSRRQFDLRNVREVTFGSAATTDEAGQVRSRTETAVDRQTELLTRLRDDLTFAMQAGSLSARQRDLLQNAREAIATAVTDSGAGRKVDARSVRLALDNIRYVASTDVIRAADRRALIDGINELRHHNSEFGRPGTPARAVAR